MSPTAGRVAVAAVRNDTLDAARLAAAVGDERAGALVTFTGVVRNHDAGRPVTGIEYVGHPSAATIIAEVATQFSQRDGVHAVAIEHRVGTLQVGDLAMVAAVAASHRGQAFSTCSDLVDRIKELLPIWKHQKFADGTAEWSNCP